MTKKDLLLGYMTIATILIISGLIMIFFSVYFGTSLAEGWLVKRGGVDTGYYHIIVTSYINSFQVAGGILLGLGLLIVSFTYYKLQRLTGIEESM